MQTGSIKRVIQFTVCLLLLGVSTFQPPTGMAQEVENPWSKPVNLSKSGSSLDPSVVVDSTGVVHAIWLDSFDGYIYSEFAGGEWSAPEKVPFPFGERGTAAVSPIQLVNDNRGFIHAFWIGPRKTLYHSFVNETHVSASGSWASSVEIAQFVTGFDIAMDADGNLHLVYVRGRDDGALPAGVYYRQSPDGFTWTSSQPIYLSPYFRSQPEAEVAHHVDISTTSIDDNNRIFVGWDDPASNRASIRRSNDGGETWDEPYDVARAGGNTFGGRPFGILVWPQGDDALVIWQTGVPDESCSTSYTMSKDGGRSWSEAQFLLGNLLGCASENQLFESSDGTAILMSTVQDQVYLLAWNGVQWSEPQIQSVLGGFKDPETGNLVTFKCPQVAIGEQNVLYYVGCDPDGTGDIWITSRAIGSVADWFPPDPVWSQPVMIASNSQKIINPISIADSTGQIHVFWTQEDLLENGDFATPIYYTRFDGNSWLTPTLILNSPDGEAENIDVTIDEKNRLFIVWNGYRSGEVYFSWASADQASSPAEWETPTILPSTTPLNTSPTIIASSPANLYVAYALPLNENRGIYLVNSLDSGVSWGSPKLVVDAVDAGLNMVDSPILARTASGRLHLIFSQNALPGDRNPITLYYVASDDNGTTWSQLTPISQRPFEWFDMVSPDARQVHNFWQEVIKSFTSVWQEFSTDDGITWSQPINITNLGSLGGLVDVTSDEANRLQLVQIVDEPGKGIKLKHWIWEGGIWAAQEDLSITSVTNIKINFIDALATKGGRLIAFIVSENEDEEQALFQLLYSERFVSLPTELPKTEVVQTPTLQSMAKSTPESQSTSEVLPTLTPTTGGENVNESNKPQNIAVIGLAAGWLLVMALVIGAFTYELRRRRNR